MLTIRELTTVLVALTCLTMVLAGPAGAQLPTKPGAADLGGTSWQFVKFQGGDDKILTPDNRAKYTIHFGREGRVLVRFDCNRGRGTWTSAGPNQLTFGPLALTRAKCPPGSLHDFFVKQWPYIRSYIMKDGHLFLSLMADGGIFEFEPLDKKPPASKKKETPTS